MEYKPGVIKDLIDVFERVVPENVDYDRRKKWSDRNGVAHIKSVMLKTNLFVLILKNKFHLGRWQYIVWIELDEKNRNKEVFIKIINV